MQDQSDDVIIRREKVKKKSAPKKSKETKDTKKQEETKELTFSAHYSREIKVIAILLMLFSLLITLALVSYTSSDEAYIELSFSEFVHLFSGDPEIQAKVDNCRNLLGLSGAVISYTLYNNTIGYAALLLPVLLFLFARDLFRSRKILRKTVKNSMMLLLFGFIFSTLMGTMQNISLFSGLPKEFSGAMGQFIAAILGGVIGNIGAFLLLIVLGVIALILGTDIDFDKVFAKLKTYSEKAVDYVKSNILKSSSKKEQKEEAETPQSFRIKPKPEAKIIEDESPEPIPQPEPQPEVTVSEPITGPDEKEPAEFINKFSVNIRKQALEDQPEVYPPINTKPETETSLPKDNAVEEQTPLSKSTTDTFDDDKQNGLGNNIDLVTDDSDDSETEAPQAVDPEEPVTEPGPQQNVKEQPSIKSIGPAGQPSAPKPRLTVTVRETEQEDPGPEQPLSTAIHDEDISYKFPDINLLKLQDEQLEVDEEELKTKAKILQEKLETFKIFIENLTVTPGPVVTQYEFVPAPGIKISKIESLADDLAMALKARGIRIIAPIPGKGTVGIEIPNEKPALVRFSSIIRSRDFRNSKHNLPLALGKSISGDVMCSDLAKMPHLLIAGSTGAGKSVGINTIISSLIFKMDPRDLKFIIIDPKKVELRQYEMLSNHFLAASPDLDELIITNPDDAVIVLKSVCAEMDKRYDILAAVGQRNIFDYNEKVRSGKLTNEKNMLHRPMPFIVVVIDELADLMLTASKEVEPPIIRIAQLARAVGIHLIVATQRPSVDVITGIIKANFPARVAYLVASKIDSRTILDMQGAEQLLGNGDMLFLPSGSPKPVRLQNSFISTDEVESLCNYIGEQEGFSEPYMLPSLIEKNMKEAIAAEDRDALFEEAARLVISQQQGSVSILQRRLKIGYARAGRIIDELESAGVVGPHDGSKARIVLMESESDLEAVL